MFQNLDVLRMSSAMAIHAGQRQAVVAQNVANADTPGYVARDLPDFKASYMPAPESGQQRATRTRHMHGSLAGESLPAALAVKSQAGPNGNQVSLEAEMLKSVGAKRQHDRALAIYKTTLGVLRSSLRTS